MLIGEAYRFVAMNLFTTSYTTTRMLQISSESVLFTFGGVTAERVNTAK